MTRTLTLVTMTCLINVQSLYLLILLPHLLFDLLLLAGNSNGFVLSKCIL